VSENLRQVEDGLEQVEDGIIQIDSGLEQIRQNLPLLQVTVKLLQTQVQATRTALDGAKLTGQEDLIQALQKELDTQNAQLAEYQAQQEQALQAREELTQTRTELEAKRQELVDAQAMLQESKQAIDEGLLELETNRSVAESEFAAAEAQLSAGYIELEAGQAELNAKKQELEKGKLELADAKTQLEEGWAEYDTRKAQAEEDLAEAEAKLTDAWTALEDGKEQIDGMSEPDVFALTRNANAGYLALDNNSDIVSGIAKVLPMFFLLIAALVCITTMTRMVEEERTQIGTLKALGHGNRAIVGKYLGYSASASLIGCALGMAVGCSFFPKLLWNAYGIIFNICPDVLLTVDWGLCIGITAAYMAVSSLVTWYCCRRTLREVPAELIRPKAPKAGKKTLLEHLPFWKKLSFLNKVMLRNVFRYRQRFLMMLIGIGGCTALLLTGFGLRDTVVDIANVQFEEVNHFDLEVYFSEGQSEEEKQAFLERLKEEKIAHTAGFFYQSSVEMDFDVKVRDVYLIAAEDTIKEYLSFRWDDRMLDMPGLGETFISVGVSELLGIGIGDEITVRNGEMKALKLKVTGIFENYVNNYAIVTPQTVAAQWGQAKQEQMAFVQVEEGVDVHEAGAALGDMEGVINITVCQDSADMVASMMDALDMVIAVVVFSAGLLAAIVLYNLTNININERIREIATIKVLGFQSAETSAYVFKENILLTVLGTGFGLALGRVFLEFVMMNIKIDMVWFKTRLIFPSYIYSVLLTLLCAAVVDLVFHYKLQKINMAEALKSVE
jgi:putative ABC transport system permease protein